MKPLMNVFKVLAPKTSFFVKKTIIIVCFDGSWLKLLHAKQSMGRFVVDGLHVKKTQEIVPEEVLMFLEGLDQSKGIGSRTVIASNPSQFTTMRVLSLPSTNPKEISEMVELQVEKLSPHGKEEALRDFRIIDQDETGYSKVALLMTHQDVVDQVVKFAESVKLEIDQVGSDVDGLVEWFKQIGAKHSDMKEGASLLIDIDAESSSVMIIDQGKPYFHRSIPIGDKELSAENSLQQMSRFVAEVRKSLEVFEAENLNIKIVQMIVTGLAPKLSTLKPLLEHECQFPVILASPFDVCELSHELEEERDKYPVSFSGLVGALFVSRGVDFTPSVIKVQRAFRARTKALMILGVQLLIGLVLAVLVLVEIAHKDLYCHDWLNRQYRMDQKKADETKLLIDQLAAVRERTQNQGKLLESIVQMHQQSPTAIRWEALNYTNDQGILLNGMSTEMPKVFEYVTALEKISLFKEPNARKVAKKKVKGEDVTEFEINCQFL